MIRFQNWVEFKYLVNGFLLETLPEYMLFQAHEELREELDKKFFELENELKSIKLEAEILENIFNLEGQKAENYKKELKTFIIEYYNELGTVFKPEANADNWIEYTFFEFTDNFLMERPFVFERMKSQLRDTIIKVGDYLHYYYGLLDKNEDNEGEVKDENYSSEFSGFKTANARYQLMKSIGVFDLKVFKDNAIPQNKKFKLLSYLLNIHERNAKKYFNNEIKQNERIQDKVDQLLRDLN